MVLLDCPAVSQWKNGATNTILLAVVPASVANVNVERSWLFPFVALYYHLPGVTLEVTTESLQVITKSLRTGQGRLFPRLERRSNPGGIGDELRLTREWAV